MFNIIAKFKNHNNSSLIIEKLDSNFLIYNDYTGDAIQVSFNFINHCFSLKNQDIKEILELLTQHFTFNCKFNELLFGSVQKENEYYKIKNKLKGVLEIFDSVDQCKFIGCLQQIKTK